MSRTVRFFLTAVLALCATTAGTASAGPAGVPSASELTSVMPVQWQGEVWTARESPLVRQNPNQNYWLATPRNVFTDDQDRLHLIADRCGINWCGAAVSTTKNDYSYGTYRFVLDTPMGDLDPNTVIGMFTFNKDVKPSHQESDVELSPWGATDPTARNAQWVIQPWKEPGHLVEFTVPRMQPMTYEFNWRPKSVTFKARIGIEPDGPVVSKWKSTEILPGVATPGTEVHLNIWFRKGFAPLDGSAQEAVFRSFTYLPRA
jgi:hypothetical protein